MAYPPGFRRIAGKPKGACPMLVLLSFILVIVVSVPAGAVYATAHDPTLIVPGQRIGSAYLGMNRLTIDEINRKSPCRVFATYDALGHSTWLETNWGGGCLISDKIQVGLPFGPALHAFGKPSRIVEDARYPHATAVWIEYQDRGIAFRVLGWHSGTTIQAIAVFLGVAAQNSGQKQTTTAMPGRVIQPDARP
jgi:hypothetical protein